MIHQAPGALSRRRLLQGTVASIGVGAILARTCDGMHDAGIGEPGPHPFFDGSRWGYVDEHGSVVIPPRFRYFVKFSEQLAPAFDDDRELLGYFRPDGSWAFHLPDGCDGAGDMCEGATWFRRESCFGLINHHGEILVEPKYTTWGRFSEGLVTVALREGFDCRRPYDPEEDYFDETLAPEKWGVINRKGEVIVAPTFRHMGAFQEGLCMAIEEGRVKWSFINRDGVVCLTLDHLVKGTARFIGHVGSFHGGRAIVHLDGSAPETRGTWIVDRAGKTIGTEFDGTCLPSWASAFEL